MQSVRKVGRDGAGGVAVRRAEQVFRFGVIEPVVLCGNVAEEFVCFADLCRQIVACGAVIDAYEHKFGVRKLFVQRKQDCFGIGCGRRGGIAHRKVVDADHEDGEFGRVRHRLGDQVLPMRGNGAADADVVDGFVFIEIRLVVLPELHIRMSEQQRFRRTVRCFLRNGRICEERPRFARENADARTRQRFAVRVGGVADLLGRRIGKIAIDVVSVPHDRDGIGVGHVVTRRKHAALQHGAFSVDDFGKFHIASGGKRKRVIRLRFVVGSEDDAVVLGVDGNDARRQRALRKGETLIKGGGRCRCAHADFRFRQSARKNIVIFAGLCFFRRSFFGNDVGVVYARRSCPQSVFVARKGNGFSVIQVHLSVYVAGDAGGVAFHAQTVGTACIESRNGFFRAHQP